MRNVGERARWCLDAHHRVRGDPDDRLDGPVADGRFRGVLDDRLDDRLDVRLAEDRCSFHDGRSGGGVVPLCRQVQKQILARPHSHRRLWGRCTVGGGRSVLRGLYLLPKPYSSLVSRCLRKRK